MHIEVFTLKTSHVHKTHPARESHHSFIAPLTSFTRLKQHPSPLPKYHTHFFLITLFFIFVYSSELLWPLVLTSLPPRWIQLSLMEPVVRDVNGLHTGHPNQTLAPTKTDQIHTHTSQEGFLRCLTSGNFHQIHTPMHIYMATAHPFV